MSAETQTNPTHEAPVTGEDAPDSRVPILSRFAGRILASSEVLEEDLEAYKRAGSSTLALREPKPVEMVPAADLDTMDEKQEAVDEVLEEESGASEDHPQEELESPKPIEYRPLTLVEVDADDKDNEGHEPEPTEQKSPVSTTETPDEDDTISQTEETDADEDSENGDEVQDETGQLRPMTEDEIYVRAFQKKHTTTKVGVGHKEPPSRGPSIQDMVGQDSRSELQKQAELRANTRLNAINKREYELKGYTDLYGEEILDKKALKQIMSESRLSSGEKHALKKAGRKARRAKASIDRLTNRLEKSAEGRDVSGRLVRARLVFRQRNKDKKTASK